MLVSLVQVIKKFPKRLEKVKYMSICFERKQSYFLCHLFKVNIILKIENMDEGYKMETYQIFGGKIRIFLSCCTYFFKSLLLLIDPETDC